MNSAIRRSRKASRRRGNRRKKHLRQSLWTLAAALRAHVGLLVLAVVCMVLVAIAVHHATTASVFQVREVLVNQCEYLDQGEVLNLVHLPPCQNIFLLDMAAIHRRLEEHPWVRSASVRRVLPSRLVVRIEEEEPEAIVHLEHLYFINPAGIVFKRVSPGDPLDFPIITGLSRRQVLERGDVDSMLARALVIMRATKNEAAAFGGLSEVKIDSVGDFSLVTEREGLVVRLGKQNFENKIHRLVRLLGALGARSGNVARIDLGAGDRAIVTLSAKGGREG